MLIVVAPCKSGFRIDVSFCFWNWFFDTFSFFFEKFSTIFFHQKIQSFLSHFWSKKRFTSTKTYLLFQFCCTIWQCDEILGSNNQVWKCVCFVCHQKTISRSVVLIEKRKIPILWNHNMVWFQPDNSCANDIGLPKSDHDIRHVKQTHLKLFYVHEGLFTHPILLYDFIVRQDFG